MDTQLFRKLIEQDPAVQKCGISPYTRQFLLGPCCVEQRTTDTGRTLGHGYSRTVVETVVNELITDEERALIFPSAYCLGSRIPLQADSQQARAVLNHLCEAHGTYDPQEKVKAIKTDIKAWTGFGFEDFRKVEGSVATKVLCMLYRFRTDIYSRLSSLLKSPRDGGGTASFEFRDAYPLKVEGQSSGFARRNVAYIADLKANMSFEMGREYEQLRQILDRFQACFESRVFLPIILVAKGWRPASSQVKNKIDELLPLGLEKRPARLDVELFLALTLLELEHRLVATDALVEFLGSPQAEIPLSSVPEPIAAFLWPPSQYTYRDVRALVTQISGLTADNASFQEAWELSGVVLMLSGKDGDTHLYFIERVAAILSVLGKGIRHLDYKSKWKGWTETSTKPWYYLMKAKKAVERGDLQAAVGGMPHAYREFWFQRYMRVLYLCVGEEGIWKNGNADNSYEIGRVIEVFRSHSIADAIAHIQTYLRFKASSSQAQSVKVALS